MFSPDGYPDGVAAVLLIKFANKEAEHIKLTNILFNLYRYVCIHVLYIYIYTHTVCMHVCLYMCILYTCISLNFLDSWTWEFGLFPKLNPAGKAILRFRIRFASSRRSPRCSVSREPTCAIATNGLIQSRKIAYNVAASNLWGSFEPHVWNCLWTPSLGCLQASIVVMNQNSPIPAGLILMLLGPQGTGWYEKNVFFNSQCKSAEDVQ